MRAEEAWQTMEEPEALEAWDLESLTMMRMRTMVTMMTITWMVVMTMITEIILGPGEPHNDEESRRMVGDNDHFDYDYYVHDIYHD